MGRGVQVACRAGEDKGVDPQEQPSVTVTLDRLHKHALQSRRRPAANLTLCDTEQTTQASNSGSRERSWATRLRDARSCPAPDNRPPGHVRDQGGRGEQVHGHGLYAERSFRTCPAAIFSDFKGNFAFCSSLPYRLPSSALPLHSVCPLGPHPLRTGRRADPTSVDM